jgi:F-type H+-transporting ATPase subunit delta
MAAGSYAVALADLAQSTNSLNTTMSDIEKVEKVFCDPAVISFLGNPTIPLAKKKDVMDELIKSSELQPHTVNFLGVVLDGERTDLLPDIVQEFEKYYNDITNTEVPPFINYYNSVSLFH